MAIGNVPGTSIAPKSRKNVQSIVWFVAKTSVLRVPSSLAGLGSWAAFDIPFFHAPKFSCPI